MRRSRLASLGAALAVAAAACEDVPLVPKWDADWNVPLPSQAIRLQPAFGPFPIPPGTSANVSFPAQKQTLDDAVGTVLQQDMRSARIILTLTKTLQFSAVDTLFVAATQADLTNAAAQRIVIPVTITAAAQSRTDTVGVTAGGLTMLRQVAQAQGDLWVQLRGRATYEGSSPLTLTASDSIGVRLALLTRIGISTR